MDGMEELALQPFVQWGFMGFAALLLAIIVWLVRSYMQQVQRWQTDSTEQSMRTTRVVEQNTAALRQLTQTNHELLELTRHQLLQTCKERTS